MQNRSKTIGIAGLLLMVVTTVDATIQSPIDAYGHGFAWVGAILLGFVLCCLAAWVGSKKWLFTIPLFLICLFVWLLSMGH